MTNIKSKPSYSIERVKEMFEHVYKDNDITQDEFNIICEAIRCLPVEIADKVRDEVKILALSAIREISGAACWLNSTDMEDKKGVIFLAPCFFCKEAYQLIKEKRSSTDSELNDPDIFREKRLLSILHEVAHFHRGHRESGDREILKKIEDEADELAESWYRDCRGIMDRSQKRGGNDT